jgi:hypothetical protein
VSIVGRYYWERGELVEVLIQWGLKSRGETYGGPRNVLIGRNGRGVVVRPFRGLRVAYKYDRGNRIPRRRAPEFDAPEREVWELERMRPCGTCGLALHFPGGREGQRWWGAHDPCIANLPGVRVACCGHGVAERYDDETTRPVETGGVLLDSCYVGFDDGLTLYGNAARAAMEMLGGSPPPPPAGAAPFGEKFVVPGRV